MIDTKPPYITLALTLQNQHLHLQYLALYPHSFSAIRTGLKQRDYSSKHKGFNSVMQKECVLSEEETKT